MRIAMVARPLRLPTDPTKWVTVPPQGYSGIHWVVTHLVDGLLHIGHTVFLLGAPGSEEHHPRLHVISASEVDDIYAWLRTAAVDMVHDHSCGGLNSRLLPSSLPYLSTHHLTGRPEHPANCVYLSRSQRTDASADGAPVVRIPVNSGRYSFRRDKDDYLLFLGRVSAFKGTYEAAAFARAAGRPLVVAGPSWESDYRDRIARDFPHTVEFVGEVGGGERLELLSGATALVATSQATMGPWGTTWREPGATVVSEAAASGTPVVATPNGCLAEIVPPVGVLVPEGDSFTAKVARSVLARLPPPETVRSEAEARWGHVRGARRYQYLYHAVLAGARWC